MKHLPKCCLSICSSYVVLSLFEVVPGSSRRRESHFMKLTRRLLLLSAIFILGGAHPIHAQEWPEEGGHELEAWTAGGYGVKGIEQHTAISMAGVRYGWILTRPHGPGFLRGRFEYAVDVVPVFVVLQTAGTAYGGMLNPLNLKWDFDSHSRVVPYVELGGGVSFVSTEVPPGASRLNFTPGGGLGLHFLLGKLILSGGVHYMHMSNAGLYPINPGVNTVELRLGLGSFTHGHQ